MKTIEELRQAEIAALRGVAMAAEWLYAVSTKSVGGFLPERVENLGDRLLDLKEATAALDAGIVREFGEVA
jgi:hypothetical protein